EAAGVGGGGGGGGGGGVGGGGREGGAAGGVAGAEGALRAMPVTRLFAAAGLLLAAGVALAGAGALAQRALAPPPGARQEAPPNPPEAGAGRGNPPGQQQAPLDAYRDPPPPGARARPGTPRLPPGGLASVCAYSPDGKPLAAGSADHAVWFFDAASGRPLRRARAHQADVTSLAFAPDGRTVAAGGADGAVCLLEVGTGKALRRFRA